MLNTTSNKKVVFIMNGPPGSGKDYAAEVITENVKGAVHLEFKKALREVAHHMTTLNLDTAFWPLTAGIAAGAQFCNELEYSKDEKAKDTITCPEFGARTWRQFLIWISETVIKPTFGQNIFGRAAAKLVQETDAQVIVFSDGGFQVEIDELRKLENVTVVVVRLYREGCDWGIDSRGYVQAGFLENTWTMHNTNTFQFDVMRAVQHHLEWEGVPYEHKT